VGVVGMGMGVGVNHRVRIVGTISIVEDEIIL
jgi:hypothetical protein